MTHPSTLPPIRLDFYTKHNCSLCDKARAAIDRALDRLPDIPVEIRERDIETNPAWFDEFRYDIPVLAMDGERLYVYRVYEDGLVEELREIWAERLAGE